MHSLDRRGVVKIIRPRFLFILVVLALAATVGTYEVKAHPQNIVGRPCVFTVPSDWGEFKGISKFGLVFEDKTGTLRIIDQTPCETEGGQTGRPQVSVEVRRR
jgi:hypothetical protein